MLLKHRIGKKAYLCAKIVIETIISVLSIFLFSSFSASRNINKLSKLQRNNNCYLLSNGPSLVQELENNKDVFINNDIIALNYFSNTNYFFQFSPKYYILLDPGFFIDYTSETDIMINNFNKINWDMVLFIPIAYKKSTLLPKIKNNFIKIIYFNANRIFGTDRFQNFCYAHNLGLPSSQNVTIPAILLMMNLNYKNIYLYGVDTSWTKYMDVDANNRIFMNDGHFYDITNIQYLEKGVYKQWLIWIAKMLESHEQLKRYSTYLGVKIINKTKGSFIDAYDID